MRYMSASVKISWHPAALIALALKGAIPMCNIFSC